MVIVCASIYKITQNIKKNILISITTDEIAGSVLEIFEYFKSDTTRGRRG